MDDKFFAIGIDFGTTYSGVAFASSANPDAIEVITAWDAAHGREKVPSKIAFDSDVFTAHWGHDIPANLEPLSWFKLLLVDEKNLSEDVRHSPHIAAARERLKRARQEPIDVVATYLEQLWEYTKDELKRRFDDLVVQYTQFKVYLTVPAIWDESARKLMREAAIRAGICDARREAKATYLELVSEPEAAALAVFHEYKGQHHVNIGDVFIVCDAGGGTVDLVSYEVLSVSPMEVREFVKGEGGMCGAIFIDEQFEAQVKRTLGKRWTQMSPASRKRVVDSQWENGIKRNFDGREQELTVALPADLFSRKDIILGRRDSIRADLPLKNGQLIVKSGHIKQWFQRVIQPTSHLIRHQISEAEKKGKKPKKSILLVGGFGSCRYLYDRLKEEFGAKGISVLQPAGPRGWTAISRGAVIRGLSDTGMEFAGKSQITSRVSRVSYGVSHSAKFDAAKHLKIDKAWSSDEGEWKAYNQMHWYLRVGDDVFDKKPITFGYYIFLTEPRDTFEVRLLRNREDRPPVRKTQKVDKFVTIKIPLKVAFDQLPRHISASDGVVLRRLDYQVQMVTTGTSMEWEVRVDGVLQGQEALDIQED